MSAFEMAAVASELALQMPDDATRARQSDRYRRVVCQQGEPFGSQIYNLLQNCVTDPEAAAAVEEVVFLNLGQRRGLAIPGSNLTAKDEAVRDKALKAAKNASKNSVFREEVAASPYIDKPAEWLASLEWLRPDLIKAREQGASESYVFSALRELLGPHDYLARVRSAIMLLMLCPNIQSIVFNEGGSNPYIRHFLKTNNFATSSDQYLKRVRNVTILSGWLDNLVGDDYVATNPLGTLTLFHRLPALEKVAIHGLAESPDGMHFKFWPPFSSNMKRLHLVHDGSHCDIIFAMIRMAKQLEEFSMIRGGRRINGGHYTPVSPTLFGRALECHKTTLRILNLDTDEVPAFVDRGNWAIPPTEDDLDEDRRPYMSDEWFRRDRDDFPEGELFEGDVAVDTTAFGETMGSLRDFSALTHLSISIKLLLGPGPRVPAPFRLVDALPPSLEHLILRGYGRGEDAHYDEQVDELLAQRARKLPKLAAVEGVRAKIYSSTTVDGRGELFERDYDCTDDDAGSLFSAHQQQLRRLARKESFHKCVWYSKIDDGWKRAGEAA